MRPGLKQIIEAFNEDRPAFERDVLTLIGMLQNEVDELKEARGEEIARELSDILIIVYSIAQWAEIDLEKEVREKIAWNIIRFPHQDFQEGDYWEIRRRIKSSPEYWKKYGEFYSIEK